MSDELVPRKDSKAGAGAAGAGSGTLMVVIAGTLPEEHPIKPWLLYSAPTVSAFASIAWLWVQVTIGNFMQERKFNSLVAKAKKAYQDALDNPSTSDEHKAAIRKQLEELEKLVSMRHMKQLTQISPISIADVQKLHADVRASEVR